MPLPRAVARVNRRVSNPVIRLVAGWLPLLAIVRHSGRVTGRAYATPVLAFGTPDGLVVALLYGARSDWARNVLAAGGAEVKRLGSVRRYAQPRLVGADEGLLLVPAILRGPFRLLRVRDCLRVTELAPQLQEAAAVKVSRRPGSRRWRRPR